MQRTTPTTQTFTQPHEATRSLENDSALPSDDTILGTLRAGPPERPFYRNPLQRSRGLRRMAHEVHRHALPGSVGRISPILGYVPLVTPVVVLVAVAVSQILALRTATTLAAALVCVLGLGAGADLLLLRARNRRLIALMSTLGQHLLRETGIAFADPDLLCEGDVYFEDCGGGDAPRIRAIYKMGLGFNVVGYAEHLQSVLNRHWLFHQRQLDRSEMGRITEDAEDVRGRRM